MISKKTAFLTTVYPSSELFLDDFFTSLRNQSQKAFDVVIINDGLFNFNDYKSKYSDLNIIELVFESSIAKNREYGINWVVDNHYDFLIFGDSDDYFEINRVELSLRKLEKFDIIVNDLNLFNNAGIYNKNYLSDRIKNNTIIGIDAIREMNFMGMSNTALRVKIIKNVFFDANLIAVDWYFYSNLLIKKYDAIFSNETSTYYRQYSNNTVGIGNIDRKSFLDGLSVKLKHYDLLRSIDPTYEKLYVETKTLESSINNDNFNKINSNIKNPFWWEEINKQLYENSVNKSKRGF